MKSATPKRRVKSVRRGRLKASGGTAAGRQIIAGLKEMVESLEAGERLAERFTVRTVEMDLNPLPYDGPAVRATRDMIGASQAVFAKLLGVSTVLVISWESGKQTPAPWARSSAGRGEPRPGSLAQACCARWPSERDSTRLRSHSTSEVI